MNSVSVPLSSNDKDTSEESLEGEPGILSDQDNPEESMEREAGAISDSGNHLLFFLHTYVCI